MTKNELEEFCKKFTGGIDIIIQLDGSTLEYTGIIEAGHFIDENKNEHIVLIPAVEVTPKW
jgi:hypothetical protein